MDVFVPDGPSAYTLEALGYSPERAAWKARPRPPAVHGRTSGVRLPVELMDRRRGPQKRACVRDLGRARMASKARSRGRVEAFPPGAGRVGGRGSGGGCCRRGGAGAGRRRCADDSARRGEQ
ncbi:hypothetical protein [Streptomyces jeddahensis]|uniref:hypothetical protein n=1 Tax=Streptomyces jeddahensis TaxID=1716141 RepID=UPI0038CD81E8